MEVLYRSILEPVEALDEVQALLVVGLGGPAGVLQALPHRIAGAAPCNRQNSSLPSPIVINIIEQGHVFCSARIGFPLLFQQIRLQELQPESS